MLTIAERLADFAVTVAADAADEQARRMELYALDTLAVMLAGTVSPSSQPMLRTILSSCGTSEATVMAHGRITSAWDAALANGTFAHALELDDDHRIAVLHPGAVVVPAALAAAEASGATGIQFLRALLVGYEVACRLGEVFRVAYSITPCIPQRCAASSVPRVPLVLLWALIEMRSCVRSGLPVHRRPALPNGAQMVHGSSGCIQDARRTAASWPHGWQRTGLRAPQPSSRAKAASSARWPTLLRSTNPA